MKDYWILGIDPGFANVGVAALRLGKLPQDDHVILLDVFRTEKSAKKANAYASEDLMRRAREITMFFENVYRDIKVAPAQLLAVCMESLSFPRNASASAKIGITCGIVSAVFHDFPILQVLPQPLKLKVAGNKVSSKADIKRALNLRFNDHPSRILEDKGIAASYCEHAYDALGAIVGCMDADLVRMIRGM